MKREQSKYNPEFTPCRALVKLDGRCNNRCIFCHCHSKRHRQRDVGAFATLLGRIPQNINQILLSGGEPTIYPDIGQVCKLLQKHALRIGFVSNGRMLSYPSLVRDFIDAGADYFHISLHSSDPETHDRITQCKGSWKETVAGIGNVRKVSPHVEIVLNCVLVRQNADTLCELVSFASELKVDLLKIQIPELKGLALEGTADKILPLSCAAGIVTEAMQLSCDMHIPVAYDGLPYCMVPEYFRDRVNSLATSRILYMSEAWENSFFRTDDSDRRKQAPCSDCALDSKCKGYYAGYDALGTMAVSPVSDDGSSSDSRKDPQVFEAVASGPNAVGGNVGWKEPLFPIV